MIAQIGSSKLIPTNNTNIAIKTFWKGKLNFIKAYFRVGRGYDLG